MHELELVGQKPAEVILSAQLAAKQLTTIVKQRENKLVIGGKQYLFFEDWQLLDRFYGVTARVISSEEIIKKVKPDTEFPQLPIAIGYLPALRQIIKQKFGTESTKELTKSEASNLIDFMDHGEVMVPDAPEDSELWQ